MSSSYTKSQIPSVMKQYFMAMMTYYKWEIEFKDLILQCSKLLNYLEAAKVITNIEDKKLAASELINNINMASSNKLEDSFVSKLVNVLANDHVTTPDAHTFAIDELFDLYVDRFGLK